MTTIQKLPEDVLTRVLFHMPNKSALRECMSVNRVFSKIALSFIYSKCILSENDLYIKPSELCFMKMKTFERIKMFGKYIRTIQIVTASATPNDLIPLQSFPLLLPYLPNIIVIDLSGTKFWKHYLDLLRLSKASQLQHIQEIKVFDGPTVPKGTNMVDLMERYFPACWRFRHSLTHLVLFDTSNIFMMEGDIKKSVDELVPHFEKVTRLYVFKNEN